MTLDQVEYNVLDRAKQAFIEAARRTLTFAEDFGFVPDTKLGASANIFSLNLAPYIRSGAENLYITLLPEGLGTADDARPEDLSKSEQYEFWYNIATKMMSALTNDAAASGLQTILLGLYLPSSSPEIVFNEEFLKGFLDGFVDGCRLVKCVYFSGETPQLKNKIVTDKLDIAGALFGLMPAGLSPISSNAIKAGDKIVFIESSGPHENGFTALRELASRLPHGYRTTLPSGEEYWRAINRGSKLYTPYVQTLLKAGIKPTNIENITGHGWQKLMRSAKPYRYVINKMLPVPEVFSFIEEHSNTPPSRMVEIFNYGAGLAVYLPDQASAEKAVELAKTVNLNGVIAGEIEEAKDREVVIEPLNTTLHGKDFILQKS
ncbi:MAG: AIR synthase related protein [Bdellovibrionota bacterium]|jgi:phosphoribosylformylglycinamidine cyclo-ligase